METGIEEKLCFTEFFTMHLYYLIKGCLNFDKNKILKNWGQNININNTVNHDI